MGRTDSGGMRLLSVHVGWRVDSKKKKGGAGGGGGWGWGGGVLGVGGAAVLCSSCMHTWKTDLVLLRFQSVLESQ